MLWIEDGRKIDKYQGQRTHDDLKDYVNRMLGSSEEVSSEESKSKEEEQWPVKMLTGSSFASGIENGVTFVKFFAPWYKTHILVVVLIYLFSLLGVDTAND